ncbi:MAG: hypothetical protein WA949_12920 [Phormidesmis sp.]
MSTKAKTSEAITTDIEKLQAELLEADRAYQENKTKRQRQILEAQQQKQAVEAVEDAERVEREATDSFKRCRELVAEINRLVSLLLPLIAEFRALAPKTKSKLSGYSGIMRGEINYFTHGKFEDELPKAAVSDDKSKVWLGKVTQKPFT